MAGHSKWANIKHKKAAADIKRGKAFTRLTKEISVAARTSSDPNSNPRLRQLIEKARNINMPLDNISRAIKRGTGELPGVQYEAHVYEGYGPHNIAVMIDVLTDNKNRTVADLRRIFSSNGGSLAENGAVSWMFKRLGVIRTKETSLNEDQILEMLLDIEIQDITKNDSIVTITCTPAVLDQAKQILQNAAIEIADAEVEWVAQNTMDLDEAQSEKAIAFLEELEEQDDVQDVYTNLA